MNIASYLSNVQTNKNKNLEHMQKRLHKAKIEALKSKLSRALENLNSDSNPSEDISSLQDVQKYIDTITLGDLNNK
tara:strand:- start:280 stop:507 length:228 start_codon:yes stop_codon:yes gene_type:complete